MGSPHRSEDPGFTVASFARASVPETVKFTQFSAVHNSQAAVGSVQAHKLLHIFYILFNQGLLWGFEGFMMRALWM